MELFDKIYYNDILLLFAALLNVCGTVYAVLSIIRLNFEQLLYSTQMGGIEDGDASLLLQREYARIGVSYIILAFLLQGVFTIVKVTSLPVFSATLIGIILFSVLLFIILKLFNKHFRYKYNKFKTNRK